MVDIKPIENSKENLAPSRKGYDIRLLVQSEVSTASDPLAIAIADIERVRHKHCQNPRPSELIKLMADCIERFKDSLAYKNAVSFVQLCLDYGTFSESPATVFEFMEANNIGNRAAEFFVQKANYLELRKRSKEAEHVLQQGIDVGAEPRSVLYLELSDLRRRHPSKPHASHSRIPVIAVPKRRKLAVYVDEGKDDSLCPSAEIDAPSNLPRILTENQENKVIAEPLVLSAPSIRCTRRLEVYRDLEERSEDVPSLSYNEQAILYCSFPEPARKIQLNVPRSMVVHQKAQIARPAMAEMYQQHGGITEPIGNALLQRCGDTEVLR